MNEDVKGLHAEYMLKIYSILMLFSECYHHSMDRDGSVRTGLRKGESIYFTDKNCL